MSIGRNDPCPCGSGRKYKRCCLPRQEVISLDTIRNERNHHALLHRLMTLAAELPPEEGLATGLIRFCGSYTQDKYDEDEVLEALDWILFGPRSPVTGLTMAERLAHEAKGLSEEEREQIRTWSQQCIPGLFHVLKPGPGEVHLRRIWDATPAYVVQDGREGLRTGDLIAAWLLPTPSGLRFGYAPTKCESEGSGALEHLLREELILLQRQRPSATWDELYRESFPRLVDAAQLAEVYGQACQTVSAVAQPVIQGTPQPHPTWQTVADRLVAVMQEVGAGPEEIAGALRLWWDAVHYLKPRVNRVEPWLGGILYILGNLVYPSDFTQRQAALTVGTSVASVGSRSRDMIDALSITRLDARYADLLDPEFRLLHRQRLVLAIMEAELTSRPAAAPRDGWFYGDTPEGRAEGLIDQAWEAEGKRRVELAQEAIALWPGAADAYVILGNEALGRGEDEEAVRLYQAGVKAGELALGPAVLDEDAGHFWGLIETRPYMRALGGLADALWRLGEHEAAIQQWTKMLRLNPGDNQGVRYRLASALVVLRDQLRLGWLLKHHGDGSATMLYTEALLAYWQHGPGKQADARLRQACQANPHVPAYLLRRRRLPSRPPGYMGFGEETEAQAYVMDAIQGWEATPGALQWLESLT